MIAQQLRPNVCMRISGHKMDSVFWRYGIVRTDEMAETFQKLGEAAHEAVLGVKPLRPRA